jgi:pimeloyl-ACP methyl ester carboxylesterase
VSEICVPMRIVYGLTDVLVPRQHGEWLARNVPRSESVVRDQGGDMSDRGQMIDEYRWLVSAHLILTGHSPLG